MTTHPSSTLRPGEAVGVPEHGERPLGVGAPEDGLDLADRQVGPALILAPLCPKTFEDLVLYHRELGLNPPPKPPPEAIMLVDAAGDLVAGVCLYPTGGTFLLAEWAVASPRHRRRLVYQAACTLADAIVARAAGSGLIPIAFPRIKSVAKILARRGFVNTGCPMLINPSPMVVACRTSSSSRSASRASTNSSTPPPGDGGGGTPTRRPSAKPKRRSSRKRARKGSIPSQKEPG